MKAKGLVDEVRELNLAYLMLAKEMIKEDKVEAAYRLGIGEELADMIGSLSTGQVLKAAASNVLMCRFRFDDQIVWNLVTNHSKEHELSNTHAAILLASQPVEAI